MKINLMEIKMIKEVKKMVMVMVMVMVVVGTMFLFASTRKFMS